MLKGRQRLAAHRVAASVAIGKGRARVYCGQKCIHRVQIILTKVQLVSLFDQLGYLL